MDYSAQKELERIARLSGLELSEEEKEILFSDLSHIVPYMERIAELDTTSESEDASQNPETDHAEEISAESTEDGDFLREDEAVESGIASEILTHAPQVKDGMFTVPRIV